MKEPFMTGRLQPHEYDYRERTKDITIYSYYEKYRTEYDEDEDEDEEETGEYESWNHDQPKTPNIDLSKVSLEDICKMLPEGVNLADVKVRMRIHDGDMGIYGQELIFYYTKTFPADMEKFKKDLEDYETRYAAYKIKKDAYDAWVQAEEKKKLEIQFEQLKIRLGK